MAVFRDGIRDSLRPELESIDERVLRLHIENKEFLSDLLKEAAVSNLFWAETTGGIIDKKQTEYL